MPPRHIPSPSLFFGLRPCIHDTWRITPQSHPPHPHSSPCTSFPAYARIYEARQPPSRLHLDRSQTSLGRFSPPFCYKYDRRYIPPPPYKACLRIRVYINPIFRDDNLCHACYVPRLPPAPLLSPSAISANNCDYTWFRGWSPDLRRPGLVPGPRRCRSSTYVEDVAFVYMMRRSGGRAGWPVIWWGTYRNGIKSASMNMA